MPNLEDKRNASRTLFGLYGTGGCAREVMPFVLCSLKQAKELVAQESIFFIETNPDRTFVNNYSVISEDSFFVFPEARRLFNIAIADSRTREKLANRCITRGAEPITLQDPTARIFESKVNDIGIGGIFCAYSVVTTNVKSGKFFHLNVHAYVAHDCIIGDFVTFAPNAHCNGNVQIHNHAYIGASAVIKQGTPNKPLIIGEGAIVGMGAVVTRDVAPYTTVVGNPARVLRTQSRE